MVKGEIQVNACYDAIIEILSHDEQYKEQNGQWISMEELFAECKKKVKGLRQIEFNAAMELEADEYTPEVKKYLTRIHYI
jgi:hypothetical protein